MYMKNRNYGFYLKYFPYITKQFPNFSKLLSVRLEAYVKNIYSRSSHILLQGYFLENYISPYVAIYTASCLIIQRISSRPILFSQIE